MPLEAGPALELTEELLLASAGDVAVGLADFSTWTMRDDRVLWWREAGQRLVDLGAGAGSLYAAAWLAPGTTVISTGEGLYSVLDGALALSPLDAKLDSEGPVGLLAAPGPKGDDLWLSADDALYLWRAGQLYRLNLGAMFEPGLRLAFGAPVDDVPALWFATSSGVYSLVEGKSGFSARLELERDAAALAAPAGGLLWAEVDGDLYRRGDDGDWTWLRAPAPVTGIAASSDAPDLWIEGGGRLWRLRDDTLHPVGELELERLLAADPYGRALVETGAGLARVVEGHPVYFAGLAEGAALSTPGAVYVMPTDAAAVASIDATLDGSPVSLDVSSWMLSLNPAQLPEGEHRLEVTVRYGDLPPATGALNFLVLLDPPGWEAEVEDLARDHCFVCHGADGGAHPMYTYTHWKDQIDDILTEVTAGRMPLGQPPLTDEEIFLLESWKASDFPE